MKRFIATLSTAIACATILVIGAGNGHHSARALAPLVLTGTPVPEPTNTPVTPPPPSPTATPVSVPTPSPTPESIVPKPQSADPYVRVSGCALCVKPGEEFEFIAMVGNLGTVDAVNVQVDIRLPANLTYVSSSASRGSIILTGGTTTLDLGTVSPAEEITFKVRVRATGTPDERAQALAVLRSTSMGDVVSNNLAASRCDVCPLTLPETGAELDDSGPTAAGLFALMLIALLCPIALDGRLIHRRSRA